MSDAQLIIAIINKKCIDRDLPYFQRGICSNLYFLHYVKINNPNYYNIFKNVVTKYKYKKKRLQRNRIRDIKRINVII